jgi:glucokinase
MTITQHIVLSYLFNIIFLRFSHTVIDHVVHTQAYSTNKHKDLVDILSTIIQFNSHSAPKKAIVTMTMHEKHQAFVTNASYHMKIISANTSDYISTKKFTIVVENQSIEQAVVAMNTHTSIRIGAMSLSIKKILSYQT